MLEILQKIEQSLLLMQQSNKSFYTKPNETAFSFHHISTETWCNIPERLWKKNLLYLDKKSSK